ncbi:MAG: cytochrome c maturation protein CcmE [Thermoleophilaceae bacterium]
MDPARKRSLRLVVALATVVLLAGALVYTSFTAATQASTPSQVSAAAEPGRSYELTGKVVDGSVSERGDELRFAIRDRAGPQAVPVVYTGVIPDPFREGREVIVEGQMQQGTFVAERDSLVTKCPSKFTKQDTASTPRG